MEYSGIWLKFDPLSKKYQEIMINKITIPVNIKSDLPNDLISKFDFISNYSKQPGVQEEELERLTKFMLSNPPQDPSEKMEPIAKDVRLETIEEKDDANTTLRLIVYDWLKRELETQNKVDLDSLCEKIEKDADLKLKKESIRGSVSSTLSALRNAYPDLLEKAWNEPVWRGKSTGRNPSIIVKPGFKMPEYSALWNAYRLYLKKIR